MGKTVEWVKTHKLLTAIIVIGGIFVVKSSGAVPSLLNSSGGYDRLETKSAVGMAVAPAEVGDRPYYNEAPPTPEITNRKVVLNSNFSLLVKNVTESVENIKAKTKELSGYMVNMGIDRSEYGESANIQVRVPTDRLDEFSKYLRGLAVKVVSENIDGTDITDQYVDIERRLSDLEKQRTRFEAILDSAETVSEMMEVQRQLFQLQDQIDAYKGQLIYMDGTSKTSKLTVYISTDELSLPYSPSRPWRPEVIFKQAVRSFLEDLQDVGTFVIWVAVYSPLIILAIVVFKVIRKSLRKSVK
jgi:hypothetical protein